MRQVETLAKEEGEIGAICDIRSDKLEVINMVKKMGYREVARADLYNEGYEDIALMKPLIENKLFWKQTY